MIPSRESIDVEFKSDRKTISNDTIVDEVVALANTDGGMLYIGVENDGTVTGAQPAHRDPVCLAALVASRTVPPVSVRVNLLEQEGMQSVVCIEVPKSSSVVASSSGRMLRRRFRQDGEPESVPMFPHEIATRLADLGRLDLSAQPVLDATTDDFDARELERLRQAVATYKDSDRNLLGLSNEELQKALRLTTRVGGTCVPTLTGLLLVGKPESIERFVPTSEAAFQVLQGTEIKVNRVFRHPLLYVVEKMAEMFEPWNPEYEIPFGMFMLSVPAFDKRAFREAVVNAFGHRDYSMLGRVRVEVQDEGLTVANPGGFVEGIGVQNLLTAEPHGRNPCLMDAFKRIGLAERTGRGIDRIFEGSLTYGKALPDYSASNMSMVKLFIARSAPDTSFVNMIAEERDKSGRALSLQALLVLDALRRSGRRSMEQLDRELDIPSGMLESTVDGLVTSGLVQTVGANGDRGYQLNPQAYGSAAKTSGNITQGVDANELSDGIMGLVRKRGSITTPEVKELLGINENQAYYAISKLVKTGELVKIGKGKNTRYQAASGQAM